MKRKEIIAIKGPRQSGKSTLLKLLKEWLVNVEQVKESNITVIDFEDRELMQEFDTNPKEFVKRFITKERFYLFIDEAQYCKNIGQKLKLIYDTFENIKIIITGSSSLELTSQTASFLTGRMFSFELYPFNFHEFLKTKDKTLAKVYEERKDLIFKFISNNDKLTFENQLFEKELLMHLKEYLVFGGYPEVVKASKYEEKQTILKNLFNTYIEKDILAYLHITDTLKFTKLVSLLAGANANLISYENLSTACNSYFKDILHIIDVLQQTYVIKLLRPFYKNLASELRKNPKVYFIDVGLRNYAVRNFSSIDVRDDSGRLAENFVLNELKDTDAKINYWRTTAKSEVDFILETKEGVVPMEVKFEAMKKPTLTRSLHSFINTYKPSRALVITKDFFFKQKINETTVIFVPITYL